MRTRLSFGRTTMYLQLNDRAETASSQCSKEWSFDMIGQFNGSRDYQLAPMSRRFTSGIHSMHADDIKVPLCLWCQQSQHKVCVQIALEDTE